MWDQKGALGIPPTEALKRSIMATFGLRPKSLLKNANRLIIICAYSIDNILDVVNVLLASVPRKNLNSVTGIVFMQQWVGARAPSAGKRSEVLICLLLAPL